MNWISVKESLPESGQDVLVYFYDKGYGIHQICIVTYFKKGDVMDTIVPNKHDIPEKNLLDALFNKDNEIKVPEDGFYIYDYTDKQNVGFRKHANVITHWQSLPKPPCDAFA